MKVLSFKSGKGGALAAIDASRRELLFSYEAEKDSFPKNTSATADTFIDGALWFDDLPDALALSGNAKTGLEYATQVGAGYFGIGESAQVIGRKSFFGRSLPFYSSSHERAHIWSAYALSPVPQGTPCYVLVWDDVLGDFYEVGADLALRHLGRVLDMPCHKFALLHGLADPAQPAAGELRDGDFSRMTGIASFGATAGRDAEAEALIARLLDRPGAAPALSKADFRDSPFCDIGTDAPRFRDLAARLSEAIFARFEAAARARLDPGRPLLIAGEGGLHCGWNSRWQESGLFSEVFVAPCAHDAGCAIGTAVDAMRHFTGEAKLDWTVYAGQPFSDDRTDGGPGTEADMAAIAGALAAGQVIGWARGNCEIGPRALGNRSILAAPFDPAMRARLNRIKGRPEDCPVAPVVLEEDAALHFEGVLPSRWMLHLQRVTDDRLGAITHADGSARIQTVSRAQNPMLHALLSAFKARTGVGVLCNTSLNFKGAGFINKTSDLQHFARAVGLDGFMAGIRFHAT